MIALTPLHWMHKDGDTGVATRFDAPPSLEMRKAEAFRALDLSEVPTDLRAWHAFEAGIQFAQEQRQ